MRAIELNSKTDNKGHLHIDYQTNQLNSNVRILILVNDDTSELEDEKLWQYSISKNPAFDFLNEPEENIYTLNDGEPFNE